MKFFLWSLMFLLGGYHSPSDSSGVSVVGQIVSEGQIFLNQKVLNKKFTDGTPIETHEIVVDPATKKTFLVEEGHVQETNDCRIRRTELTLTGEDLRPLSPGLTETCAGRGCSHCVFKERGGCKCKNSVNICEHTISRYTDDFFDIGE